MIDREHAAHPPACRPDRDEVIKEATARWWWTSFGFLAQELIDRRSFHTQADARMAVFAFLEGWYNTGRRYSALGYLSPNDFERRAAATAGQLAGNAHHRDQINLEPSRTAVVGDPELNSCIWTPPTLAEATLTDPAIGTIAVVYPALMLEERPPGHDGFRALSAN